ncbi:hypothetical protein D9V96_008295 [Zobellia laminariae]|uniref:hypothetical protein n=1 Tax=Zobellia laminariae TaxID=248906 RepID=UPI0012D9C7AB|nr:hypothetical protein [Zobellia laminariae]
MGKNTNSLNNSFGHDKGKNRKKEDTKRLFQALMQPQSRRMAATNIGYEDLTYMVTQNIYDWIKQGKAAVIGQIRCSRSNRWVQSVTTNPDLFPIDPQLSLFE